MRVKWLREARANLDAEAQYVAQNNPPAAARVVASIVEAANHLRQHPALGRPGRVVGTRELVVPGTPYIVPYRLRGGSVEILRVLHAARRWPVQF